MQISNHIITENISYHIIITETESSAYVTKVPKEIGND